MHLPSTARRVYRIGPWRRYVLWYTLGPLLAFLIVLAASAGAAEQQALWGAAAVLFLIMAPFEWLIRRTRLEVDGSTVRLVQTGYTLATPTRALSTLRLKPGHEGLITREPMEGTGARRLAGLRGFGLSGAPMFDAEEQRLLAERRYLPLAAFAWYLRRGDLRDTLLQLAPQLATVAEVQAAPARGPRNARARLALVLCFCLLLAGLGAALAAAPERIQSGTLIVAWAALAPILCLRAVLSTVNAWRAGSRLLPVIFAALALLMLGWTIASWSQLLELLPGG